MKWKRPLTECSSINTPQYEMGSEIEVEIKIPLTDSIDHPKLISSFRRIEKKRKREKPIQSLLMKHERLMGTTSSFYRRLKRTKKKKKIVNSHFTSSPNEILKKRLPWWWLLTYEWVLVTVRYGQPRGFDSFRRKFMAGHVFFSVFRKRWIVCERERDKSSK